MHQLRPATSEDFPAIRALIREVGINPMGLDWQRFVIVVDDCNGLLACGQIKPHGDGTRELASIAVRPGFQGQGLARQVIEELVRGYPEPLYLTCRDELQPLYEKFGFRVVPPGQMPPYFRWISRAFLIYAWMTRYPQRLLVMKREGEKGS